MTKITLEQIEHLAHLTRLELTEAQKESLLGDMESILGLVGQLDAVDVSDVEENGYPHVHHKMTPLTGVASCEDTQQMMQNIQHPLKDNGVVLSS